MAFSPEDRENLHVLRGDVGSVIVCRMSNGAVATLNGLRLRGHGCWYRFHGTRGLMENLRTGDRDSLRILHEPWDMLSGDEHEKIYKPDFPVAAELARAAGHGGGDFFVNYHFAEAIRKNEQPWLNVYRGIDMSLIAPQAWRSCLDNGASYEIPDFRDENVPKRYENDDFSPFPEDRRPDQPWPSIKGEIAPSPEAVEFARKTWAEMGYHGE